MADTEKQPKYAPLKRLQLTLQCEWSDCYFKASSMPKFINHIETHFQCFLPEGVTADNYTSRQLETDGKERISHAWRKYTMLAVMQFISL